MEDNLHILIVDDDVGMTKTLGDILELVGHEVGIALSGREAIAKVRAEPFDCIFMDIRMPGMNGVEAFKQIKELAPACPVVMMTAYAVHDLIEEAKREGALAVLDKPIDPARLIGMVEALKQESAVIIVDDDRDFCKTLGDGLEAKGYRVAAVHDGPEAIELAQRETFDFIVLDMRLPEMDGLDVMGAVREIDPKIAVILMSGHSDMEPLMEAGRDRCAYAALRKPFEMDRVLRLLEEIRRRRLAETL